jgi:hypothetical protein
MKTHNIIVTLSKSDGRVFADVEGLGAKFTSETTFATSFEAEKCLRARFDEYANVSFKYAQKV